ncbi:hypothetical protein DID78_03015 [Candidatus Marinamargulisbacteria bacterium SCGC AG-343-D04]|nr:hypothetical protein DID78_03015 [Candidatus Marinamargulisbacteria bacterium SCGC AG-343-D04]
MNWKHCYLASLLYLLCVGTHVVYGLPFVLHHVPTTKNVVALTFDDGPNKYSTNKILDTLKKNQIHASFFLIAKQVEKYPQISQNILKANHTVGNHSFAHQRYDSTNKTILLKDIAKSQLIFHKHLKMLPDYFRPPYGQWNKKNNSLFKHHFTHILKWNIDPEDWKKSKSEKAIISDILKHLKPGGIIVLHDNKKTAQFLPKLIKKIRSKGYSCVSIDEMLRLNEN